jgi:uncharacterized protein involved in outer membrane biogenesis
MKKLLVRLTVVLIVLLILGVVGLVLSLDSAVKRGVETIGPKLTQVSVKLDSVSLSLLSGAGKLKGLVVGNPTGYKTPSAISVGQASLALQPSSILSSKVVIHSIDVQAPEITFETDLKGNNLNKILANLKASTGGGGAGAPAQTQAGKKLQVDDFRITGGQVHVSVNALGNQASATVALPEIHLSGLGQGPDGITAAELTTLVLQAIEKEAVQLAGSVLSSYGKDLSGLTKALSGSSTNTVDQVTKGLGGFLNKKK